jgi:hypothetical protein
MAKLTAKQRKSLPKSTFAGPGRSFPIPDKNHAKAALIDVGRAKGLSSGEKAEIKARAKAKLKGKR